MKHGLSLMIGIGCALIIIVENGCRYSTSNGRTVRVTLPKSYIGKSRCYYSHNAVKHDCKGLTHGPVLVRGREVGNSPFTFEVKVVASIIRAWISRREVSSLWSGKVSVFIFGDDGKCDIYHIKRGGGCSSSFNVIIDDRDFICGGVTLDVGEGLE